MSIRVFSYGGGVQSTAALVLASQGEIDFPTFLFANVGENSENPDTLEYVRCHAAPRTAQHGIGLHEVRREYRDQRGWTLWDKLIEQDSSIGIPIRLERSGAPARRNCTQDFKINVIAKWLRQHGATRECKAAVGLGISRDEFRRMRTDSGFDYYALEYPLVDRRLDRSNCVAIIQRAGLPVPPKSSCFFCPFGTLTKWRRLKRDRPDLFEKTVGLERLLSERGVRIGSGHVFMTDSMVPLDQAVGTGEQLELFGSIGDDEAEDTCETGYCMT